MDLAQAAQALYAEIRDNPDVQTVGITDDSIVVYMKKTDPRLRKKYRNGFETYPVTFKKIGKIRPL
jgi:hypothetical protein